MRKKVAIGAGAAIAAVLTHGLVYSASNLSGPLPVLTYQGSFQSAVLSIWRGWTGICGLAPMSHVEDFARFFAHFVLFVCPILGFIFYAAASRQSISWQWWKPLAIVVAFATPLEVAIRQPLLLLGLNEPLAEAMRAVMVFILMIASIQGIRIRSPWQPSAAKASLAT